MKTVLGFIITAGHLDIEWYQPLRSYRFWTVEALEDLKKAAAERPDFKTYVLDGQFFPLEEYLDVVPEDEDAMRQLIRDKKLAVGPFYTQFDEWIPSAESMIRNCLYGDRKSKQYGGYMRAGYLPDNFGHPCQLPQILRGFGIDSLMFMRGLPEIPGGHPDEFLYRGIDGSQVLVSHFRESYSGAFDLFRKEADGIDAIQPREVPYYGDYLSYEWHKELADHDNPLRTAESLVANVRRFQERYPSGVIPLIAGFDHLPPQINIGDSVWAANEMQQEIEFVMGSAEDYVSAVRQRIKDPSVYDMELIGSMYQYVLLGALSTRTYLKRQNFACEALLERYAEPLTAMAKLYGYADKPALLDEAWRNMMINSAHDSIHGSSVDEVHVEMEGRFGGVRQIAAGIIHDAMKHIGKNMRPWWNPQDKGVLVYSPAPSPTPQPAELWLPTRGRDIVMTDAQGNPLPTQILEREPIETNGIGLPRNEAFPHSMYRKVLFLHTPSMGGIESFAAVQAEKPPLVSPLTASDTLLENELLRVSVEGALIHIYDKRAGRWLHSLNLLEEDADAGDAWDYSPAWIPGETVRSSSSRFTARLTEHGLVRATIRMEGVMNVPAALEGDRRSERRAELPVAFDLSLYSGIPRVDVKLTLDNTARDHRIRLRVPTGVRTDFIRSQGHLAILDRPIERQKEIERWIQPPTQLLPCREWVAAEQGEFGLAVALKGIYDYEAVINPLSGQPDLYFTLVRGFELMSRINTVQREGHAAWPFPTPGAQCLGEQVIEWSYLPYCAQKDEKAPFLAQAQSFLYPAAAHAVRAPQQSETIERRVGPLCRWEEPNVQFSALKPCYDRDGMVLRVFENQGRAAEARITLSPLFQTARLCDMNEASLEELPIQNGVIAVKLAPYQAVSVKLTPPQP